ncbi:MAG: GTP 3',8-cyclase MoaA [Deltaproteobacteria bacterium CG_4_8_14_3_um_filter_51_11]|nr:GTP 3',8-cyclase MoaA [bacterium]OIP39919.1 MAG: cyclic pyranopterin phosphate synthase MoaA [Desulfobacteraceae bacterium CG2_30_51_40]PIP47179.1 MAG: GTP 3',8-cyclase MoaA [Deltaproteobacteria bacterium CG23_combo_of_CG06-09_8_20_14_all_51_20]PIX19547.1 MAG: GTP 3',8-cyclase MoaA [Deltaproteobacteria bacterium CG_4_8_14_3_um_filter_51_11]PIY27226.1 MAG: GTP 3',8-cyclase MoaA [Deltaproteobacteria bacterium CG_4_10_14_3_um_filter_51_14]PJB34351.1 MAG: GTP 3',8-cyclase MoaA [Deltaproteobacte
MAADTLNAGNNRIVTYLRLSVTDRCNLRCRYCMPPEGVSFVPHEEILSFEEMARVVRLSSLHGIRKVRITGGEPLVRKGLTPFLKTLSSLEGLDEITLTTNGVLLEDYARDLKNAGIRRINISLDSLKPQRFLKITGRDYFDKVIAGIRAAQEEGLSPIKINVVVMRGINDDELLDFAALATEKPIHVRFIEFMPIGGKNGWRPEEFVSIDEMLEIIRQAWPLTPIESGKLDGPALKFRLGKGDGEIGLIGALSNHFCAKCNRLRLTAEGQLRGCLFSDQEIDLKGPLRSGAGDDLLLELMRRAVETKPENHNLLRRGPRKCARLMSSIGG